LYEICLQTGAAGHDASDKFQDPYMIGQYFVAPYLFSNPEACFVAELEGRPIGYIVGTHDTQAYHQWLNRQWLPTVRPKYSSLKPGNTLERFLFEIIQETTQTQEIALDYPGHLHIDLLPIAQGKGFGKKLMIEFMSQMQQQQCSGIHLGADATNENAVAFYRKLGFRELSLSEGAIYMGIEPSTFLEIHNA
jgi:ribosomal protein S18 acetylase RimI-like enzyme